MSASLFTNQTPTLTNANDGVPYCLGTLFTTAADGSIAGVRWYFPATLPSGTVTGGLFQWTSDTAGVELARADFANPVAGGWNSVLFASPPAVTAGQRYLAVVRTPNRYVATSGFFTGFSLVNGQLTASADNAAVPAHNGKFDDLHGANAGLIYPQQSFGGGCYFVDILFDLPVVGAPGSLGLSTVAGGGQQSTKAGTSQTTTAAGFGALTTSGGGR
jgi:hypothetical protein